MRRYFITGIVIILPIAVTIWVFSFIVNFLTNPFLEIAQLALSKIAPYLPPISQVSSVHLTRYISQGLVLICLFFVVILLGMLARWFFFKSLIRLGDYIMRQIPIVNKVYKAIQDVIHTIFVSEEKSFKQVVLTQFPNSETYCLGFLVRKAPISCTEAVQKNLTAIFIPTAPSPFTGFLIFQEVEKIHFIDMKIEDAFKLIMSCGVIVPEGSVKFDSVSFQKKFSE